MDESLYATVEGPNGTAEIFEVNQIVEPDRLYIGFGSSTRIWDVQYEVRFGSQRQSFWQEGEAATVACQMVGIPYGGDTGPAPAGPRRGVALAFD